MSEPNMTESGVSRTSHSYGYPAGRYDYAPTATSVSGGISILAGFLLAMAAAFEILQGVAVIAQDEIYAAGVDYVYAFDTTAWGWVHVVLGVLVLLVAIGIMAGQAWGQVTGLMVAGLSMLVNFMFLPHYPLWSLTIIALNVVVVWALCAQLREPAPATGPGPSTERNA